MGLREKLSPERLSLWLNAKRTPRVRKIARWALALTALVFVGAVVFGPLVFWHSATFIKALEREVPRYIGSPPVQLKIGGVSGFGIWGFELNDITVLEQTVEFFELIEDEAGNPITPDGARPLMVTRVTFSPGLDLFQGNYESHGTCEFANGARVEVDYRVNLLEYFKGLFRRHEPAIWSIKVEDFPLQYLSWISYGARGLQDHLLGNLEGKITGEGYFDNQSRESGGERSAFSLKAKDIVLTHVEVAVGNKVHETIEFEPVAIESTLAGDDFPLGAVTLRSSLGEVTIDSTLTFSQREGSERMKKFKEIDLQKRQLRFVPLVTAKISAPQTSDLAAFLRVLAGCPEGSKGPFTVAGLWNTDMKCQ